MIAFYGCFVLSNILLVISEHFSPSSGLNCDDKILVLLNLVVKIDDHILYSYFIDRTM